MSAAILGRPETPVNVAILAKSHNSITVGWEVGLNGGSKQHFKILYREKGQINFQENSGSIFGLKTGESINYTIHGLYAKKEYEIIVVAINQFRNNSQSKAAAIFVTTEGMLCTSIKFKLSTNLFSKPKTNS